MGIMQQSWTDGASAYLERFRALLSRLDPCALDRGIALIEEAWRAGKQVITCGNGGSALTALHYITDWNKLLADCGPRPFRGRCLAENIGLLSAYANDVSYLSVFREQLRSVLEAGDLLVAVSCSGNSENVLRAVDYANAHGAKTLGLCGFWGGKLRNVAQHVILVPCDDMQLCEDVNAMFGHIVVQTLLARTVALADIAAPAALFEAAAC
jgi:D-sedoheptulose 7-phosphate isomerase